MMKKWIARFCLFCIALYSLVVMIITKGDIETYAKTDPVLFVLYAPGWVIASTIVALIVGSIIVACICLPFAGIIKLFGVAFPDKNN